MNDLNIRIAILALLLCTAQMSRGQNTLDKAGLGSGVTSTVAYSFRRLSTSYAGSSIKIQRSSDNATQDIGFTAGGELDTTSLKTFVGSNNGYIATWYDQSGHATNLTQNTAGNQPILVNAGVINRENTKPFIRFWGAPHVGYNSLVLPSPITTVGHVSSIMKFAAGGYGFFLSHSSAYYWHSNPGVNLFYSIASSSVLNAAAWSNGSSFTPTSMPWPGTLTVEEVEPQTPSSGTDWDNIGSDRGSCCHELSGGGGYSELIVFASALSTPNRQALAANQLLYFGVVTLPITWLSFTAQMDKGKTYLQWQTAAERNTREFAIEYSTDGRSWTRLATLPAAGNSSNSCAYSYVHYNPEPGGNYYRITCTDDDGASNYSSIVAVNLATPASRRPDFQVLQNPISRARLSLRVNTAATFSIVSMDGKVCWQGRLEPGTREVAMDGYPKGLYFVTTRTTTTQVLIE